MVEIQVRDTKEGTWYPVAKVSDEQSLAAAKEYNSKLNEQYGWTRTRMVKPRVGFVPNNYDEIVEV